MDPFFFTSDSQKRKSTPEDQKSWGFYLKFSLSKVKYKYSAQQ